MSVGRAEGWQCGWNTVNKGQVVQAEVTEAGRDWITQPVSQQEKLERHCQCSGKPSRVVNQKAM